MDYKKVLVITITFDRLETTKQYLKELKEKAGHPFEHIVIDNGSEDDTVKWLKENNYTVIENGENLGIVGAWVKAYRFALERGFKPDYVLKYDNDCEIATEGILAEIMKFYEENGDKYVVAPLDLEILPDYQPVIVDKRERLGSFDVKITTHTGGMFTVIPVEAFDLMVKQNNGQGVAKDIERGGFWRKNGYLSVYIQSLKTYHRGQGKGNGKYKF